METKKFLYDLEKIDRMIYLHGLLKVITSQILYYHYATEYEALQKEFYEAKNEPIPAVVVF